MRIRTIGRMAAVFWAYPVAWGRFWRRWLAQGCVAALVEEGRRSMGGFVVGLSSVDGMILCFPSPLCLTPLFCLLTSSPYD